MSGGDPPLSSGVGGALDPPGAAAVPHGARPGPVQSSNATLIERRISLPRRRVCDALAAGLWRPLFTPPDEEKRDLAPIPRDLVPRFCHVSPMGQMLLLRRPVDSACPAPSQASHQARRQEPGAPARGILLALALSSVAWLGIAVVLQRLW